LDVYSYIQPPLRGVCSEGNQILINELIYAVDP